MRWDDYIADGTVRKGFIDLELASSLIKMSDTRLLFLSKQVIDAFSASIIAAEYYEAVREVCEALLTQKGFKSYSHEAITSFIKEVLKDEPAAISFDRYRKIRNSINYYGRQISKEEGEKTASEIKQLIAHLKVTYLKK